MRRSILAIGIAILLVSGLAIAAENRFFYTSGKIVEGEEWANVGVYNDTTVVDMNGGLVDGIASFNASTVNITAGQVYTVDALEFSTVNISGGHIGGIFAEDNSLVTFSDNSNAVSIGAREFSTLLMNGGETDYLRAGQDSIINIYAGTVSEFLNAWDTSIVNIYSNSFVYDPIGGDYDGGQLKGFYLDGSPLLLDLYDAQTYSHINFIPEPATLLLLGLGGIFIKKKH